jgi:uncharacterized protein YndB with AHSA1/START domain
VAVQKQLNIKAPAEKVFSYLADITRHSEWGRPQFKQEIEKTSEGPVGQGSTFRSVGHQFGRNEDTVTITEYVPNQRLAFESDGKAGLIRHTFELQPEDGGTRVTKRFEPVRAKFPFMVFLPFVQALALPGALEGDLERIKENIERS